MALILSPCLSRAASTLSNSPTWSLTWSRPGSPLDATWSQLGACLVLSLVPHRPCSLGIDLIRLLPRCSVSPPRQEGGWGRGDLVLVCVGWRRVLDRGCGFAVWVLWGFLQGQ